MAPVLSGQRLDQAEPLKPVQRAVERAGPELDAGELGPGTLYGALDRLERLGLIESLPAEDRRHPYRITAPGAAALTRSSASRCTRSAAGRLRLRLGGI